MDQSNMYKVLVNLISTVKSEEDKTHLKKEIKKQLSPAFTSREGTKILEALECYKVVCQTLKTKNFQWDILDDIDDLLLSVMENEQVITLRKCYEEILLVVVSQSGLSCLKWSNRLIDLFKDYCRVDVAPGAGLKGLLALKAFILNTWPRLKENWGRLTAIALEALYDLHYSKLGIRSSEETSTAKNICVECITLLNKAMPSEINQFITEILKKNVFDSSFNALLAKIITA